MVMKNSIQNFIAIYMLRIDLVFNIKNKLKNYISFDEGTSYKTEQPDVTYSVHPLHEILCFKILAY